MTPNRAVLRATRNPSSGGVRLPVYIYLVIAMLLPCTASAEYNWSSVKIGAGGFLSGMDVHSDGTRVVRTDTYGAYKYNTNTNKWEQLVTMSRMPSADSGVDKEVQGVFEIKIAPTDSDIMYMALAGYVYKTTDGGLLWTRTGFTKIDPVESMRANGTYDRLSGQKMAIDPANEDVVYLGSRRDGLFKTDDGGDTWSSDSGVAHVADPGITGICFDDTSAVVGTKTQTIYASSATDGIYRTTNGGTSWTQISDGTGSPPTPTEALHATCANGIYYVTDAYQGTSQGWAWRYDGSWTDIEPRPIPKARSFTIIVDPNDSDRIVVGIEEGNLAVSNDGGDTFSSVQFPTLTASTNIPWHSNPAAPPGNGLSSGEMAFSPDTVGEIWFAQGIGFWTTTLETPGGTVNPTVWTENSSGIEQIVGNEIVAAPNESTFHFCGWDRGTFSMSDVEVFPSAYGPVDPLRINHCWGMDYVVTDTTNPKLVQANRRGGTGDQSASSTDRGVTWTEFTADFIGFDGGDIAASTDSHYIAYGGNNKGAFYTADSGATWTLITDFGLLVNRGFSLNRHIVTCDTVTADKCWLYYVNNWNRNDADKGVWKTTDGGAGWTKVHSSYLVTHGIDSFNGTLRAVPGNEDHLFWTGGHVGVPGDANPAAGSNFMRSTDGGTNWTNANTNVQEVYAFGFGDEQSGGYPSIFIIGWVSSVYGIWRSDDNAVTWDKIGDYPMGIYDQAFAIEGAKDGTDRVFVGFRGTGYAYGVPSGSDPKSDPLPPLPPVLLP